MASIASAADLERWLSDKPQAWAAVIAARAALRVLPLVGNALPAHRAAEAWRGDLLASFVLPIFRGMAASWVAANFPAHGAGWTASVADARAHASAAVATASPAVYAARANVSTAVDAAVAAAESAVAAADAAVAVVSDAARAYAASVAAAAAAGAAASAAAVSDGPDRAIFATRATQAAGAASIWTDVRADLERLEGTGNATELLSLRLWLAGGSKAEPRSFLSRRWQRLARLLLAADRDWKVWTDWYSARWNGRPAMAEEIEIFRVTLNGEDDWKNGPAHVNRLIAAKIAEVEGRNPKQDPQVEHPPLPPPPKAASIEPRVVSGKVSVPLTVAELTFDSAMMTAVLAALAGEVTGLAADMRATPQYDQHAVAHLETIAVKLDAGHPNHTAFFAVCMEYETLRNFRSRVEESWPEIFVSRYRTVLATLKSAVDKFPPWREFRKAHTDDEPELTAEQMEVLRAAADATIAELRAPENEAFVHPSTPEAVEKLAEEFAEAVAEATSTADPLPLRMALRARDFVESLANTAKRFAELGAAKVSETAAPVGGFAKRVGGKMADGFTKELEKSLEKIAKDAGKEAPYAIGRFLKRAFVGGVVGSATLATAFPEAFGWLPAFIAALMGGAAPAVLPKRRKGKEKGSAEDEKG